MEEIRKQFPNYSESGMKLAISRFAKKGLVVPIIKGLWLIISPQYIASGVLPVGMLIDNLMRHLGRPYYSGLLGAASYHIAPDKRPQEFYVVTNFPALDIAKRRYIKINYISARKIPEDLIDLIKTDTGYLYISSPELTATDLVHYQNKIGGLSRVASVLKEMTGVFKAEHFSVAFVKQIPINTIQRLGYILEKVLGEERLANHLLEQIQKAGLTLFRIPLKSKASCAGFPGDEKWKVAVNIEMVAG